MIPKYYGEISYKLNSLPAELANYLNPKRGTIFALVFIALCAYGFELFNFNLTIDEEVHATYLEPTLVWIATGRWGMYLLNKFLIPYTIIPFVPLFTTLAFHIGATLLLLDSWDVNSNWEQVIIGSIGIVYPGMAYLYTFSTLNFGIGFGFFCVALSLFIFTQYTGAKRFFAIIPAAYSMAIYQGFVPALAVAYLFHVMVIWLKEGRYSVKNFTTIAAIHLIAGVAYYLVHKLFLIIFNVSESSYTSQYFHLDIFGNGFRLMLERLWVKILYVYKGDGSIYGIEVTLLGIMFLIGWAGHLINVYQSKISPAGKVLLVVLLATLLLLPFAGGIVTQGLLAMRFLVALPIAISGTVMLGLKCNFNTYRLIFSLIAGLCIFQFIESTNHLFASSNLALQADRLLASRIIERIDAAKADVDNAESIKYLEIIGFLESKPTQLIPKTETFGVSFFEWDQGNVSRILLFMQTIGYDDLRALPRDRRGSWVELANSMPVWPEKGSVLVIDDTVLLKFGSYSNNQKRQICTSNNQIAHQIEDFCP